MHWSGKRQWTPLLLLFLTLRVVYSAVGGVMASRPDPEPLSGGPVFDASATLLKPDQLSHLLVNVWSRWDTPWYLKIAAFGYDAADGTSVYMPLYPWLIRGFAFSPGTSCSAR